MKCFPDEMLWKRPSGVASVAFHLQHIPGVIDRLFTYADGNSLSNTQLKYLSEEGLEADGIKIESLLARIDEQINRALDYLKKTDESALLDRRTVGRKNSLQT